MEVRDYIINEADKLFCQYGFKSVTMDDIAKQLGVSKKTIYQHFKDKNDLVNVLMDARYDNHNCEMKLYAEQGIDAIQEVLLALADVNEWLTTLSPKLFHDLQKYHHVAWLKFKQFKEESLSIVIANNLKRGIKEGVYRSDINLQVLTELRLAHSQLILTGYDQYAKNKFSIAQVMIEVTQHFLFGIVSDKGRELLEKYNQQHKDEQLIK